MPRWLEGCGMGGMAMAMEWLRAGRKRRSGGVGLLSSYCGNVGKKWLRAEEKGLVEVQ